MKSPKPGLKARSHFSCCRRRLELNEAPSTHIILELARRIAREAARRQPFSLSTADDLYEGRRRRGHEPSALRGVAGQIFRDGSRTHLRVKSRRAGNHGRELRVWRLVNRPCPWPSPKVCSSPFALRVDGYRRGEELSPEAVEVLLGASQDVTLDGILDRVGSVSYVFDAPGSPGGKMYLQVLHVLQITEAQESLLVVAFERRAGDPLGEDAQWSYEVRESNESGLPDIVIGPKVAGRPEPRAAWRWSKAKRRFVGPSGGIDQAFLRLESDEWNSIERFAYGGMPNE